MKQRLSFLFFSFLFFSFLFFNVGVGLTQAQAQAQAASEAYNCPGLYYDGGTGKYNEKTDGTAGKTIQARDLSTAEDVRAFVRCAAHFIADKTDEGKDLDWLRDEFRDPDGPWRSASHYIWVDQNTDGANGNLPVSQIYPPDKSKEGHQWQENAENRLFPFKYAHHVVSRWFFEPAEGWVDYKWRDPATNTQGLKLSYIMKIRNVDFSASYGVADAEAVRECTIENHDNDDEDRDNDDEDRDNDDEDRQCTISNQNGFVVGAGVYSRDLQLDSCDAAGLHAAPTTRKLQDFVRCAASRYAKMSEASTRPASIISSRFFAHPDYGTHLRSKSIYTFAVDASTGDTSSDGTSAGDTSDDGTGTEDTSALLNAKLKWSAQLTGNVQAGADPEWKNAGAGNGIDSRRNVVAMMRDIGEGFLYYRHENPATGTVQRKVVYVKLVSRPTGEELIGAGYYLPLQGATLEEAWDCDNPPRKVTAASVETPDDVRAFVMQARCYIQDNSIRDARKQFADARLYYRDAAKVDTQWFSHRNGIYLFVDEHKLSGNDSRLLIYPRNPDGQSGAKTKPCDENAVRQKHKDDPASRDKALEACRVENAAARWDDNGGRFNGQGSPYGDFEDVHGNSYYPEVFRIQSLMDEGWMYYSFSRPGAEGQRQAKASYIATFEEGGKTYRIGAGIYDPRAPANCEAITADVLKLTQDAAAAEPKTGGSDGSSRLLNGQPSFRSGLKLSPVRDKATRDLQAFVRCAAREFEMHASVDEAKKTFLTGTQPGSSAEADRLARPWRSTGRLKRTELICSHKDSRYIPAVPAKPAYRILPSTYTTYWVHKEEPRFFRVTRDTTTRSNERFLWDSNNDGKIKGAPETTLVSRGGGGNQYLWYVGTSTHPSESTEPAARRALIGASADESKWEQKTNSEIPLTPKIPARKELLETCYGVHLNYPEKGSVPDEDYIEEPTTKTRFAGGDDGAGGDTDDTEQPPQNADPQNADKFVDVLLDGQFFNAPIYTFLYDDKGKIVWGRDATGEAWKMVFDDKTNYYRTKLSEARAAYAACQAQWTRPNTQERHCSAQKKSFEFWRGKHEAFISEKSEEKQRRYTFETDQSEGSMQGALTLKRWPSLNETFVYYKARDYKAMWQKGLDTQPLGMGSLTNGYGVKGLVYTTRNKRAFVKRVRTRDGKTYYLGAGLYE